jgi:PDZ domain-containing protein
MVVFPHSIPRLLIAFSAALFALAVAANVVHSPYVALSPGPAFDASHAISGPFLNPALPAQHFYITTVDSTPQTWWAHLVGLASTTPTLPASPVPASPDAINAAGAAQMTSSQRTALYLATPHPTLRPAGAQVILAAPAARVPLGAVIVSVNTTPTATVAALLSALARVPPGALLRLTTHQLDSPRLTTINISHYGGHGSLGIELTDWLTGHSPYTLSVPGVNGSSGGLMLALATTAATSAGSLSGPYVVAGTGTIAPSGKVGAIEGVAQKVASARAVHATLFFVAPANYPAARQAASSDPTLHVVSAATYTAALRWLCTHGASSTACTAP